MVYFTMVALLILFNKLMSCLFQNYRVLEQGHVVLYTTSMMIVRTTHEKCIRVKKILQTHMVQHEEKDIFMSRENQRDLMTRLEKTQLDVPHVFADGQYLGASFKSCLFPFTLEASELVILSSCPSNHNDMTYFRGQKNLLH